MKNSKVDQIWQTDFRYMIDRKWDGVKNRVLVFSVFHLIFLFMATIYATTSVGNVTFMAIMLVWTVIYVIYEGLQIAAQGLSYFADLWNYFDLFGLLLFLLHLVFLSSGFENESSDANPLLATGILFMCGRGVGDLRAFEGTRYLVRLIIEVFIDLPSFLVIFFMIFYLFAVLYYVMEADKDDRDAKDWIL